jgi:16S rRNA (uracil1498-N3)-methyltransferase
MHRFFIHPDLLQKDQVTFPTATARQMRNVLRLKPGDIVTVLDNRGNQYQVEINLLTSKQVKGQITARSVITEKSTMYLHLAFALTQREKVEWILQKCTELGASRLTPFIAERSLARAKVVDVSKVRRWEKIVQEAAEQSGRSRLPELGEVVSMDRLLKQVNLKRGIGLVAWEGEQKNSLISTLKKFSDEIQKTRRVTILIGPEGGFTDVEVALVQRVGLTTVTLGARVLRMETAAVAACAVIMAVSEPLVS